METYGADILRLWVASVDYSIDIKVGENLFKQLSDIYRNFRNTARYMLGNLFDYDPVNDYVSYDELWSIDKLVLNKLQDLIAKLGECFDNYQFFKYYQLIQNFCSVDLSAFYFDIIKDRLYTHGKNSKSRRAAQTVCYELLSAINRMFVPVLPHLAEDIFNYSPEKIKEAYLRDRNFFQSELEMNSASILLSNWPVVKEKFVNLDLAKNWNRILELRDLCNKEIEVLRQEKIIGKSLEAGLSIKVGDLDYNLLKEIKDEIKTVFIISDLKLEKSVDLEINAFRFEGIKCVRCWKLFNESEIHNQICGQCKKAICD
jgi:isoleucyl-tRNA synthetase